MPNRIRENWMWQLHHNGLWLITLLSSILLINFVGHFDIYIYIPVKVKRMPLERSTFSDVENNTPLVGLEPRSQDYISSSINSRHVSDHQNNVSWICFYISVAPNKEIVYENDKNMNCRCPMTAILNFTICGKTVPFTAWHTAEMDSA